MLCTCGKAPEIAYKVRHMAKATFVMTVGLAFNMTMFFQKGSSQAVVNTLYILGWLISCIGIALLGQAIMTLQRFDHHPTDMDATVA